MGRRKGSSSTTHGVLVVDKASGCTSHDVVSIARKAYRTRAVGHAGTLDPMATGVLVLAIGQATKLVPHLTSEDKSYETVIGFGTSTDTLDADGTVTDTKPAPTFTADELEERLDAFRGRFEQKVPKVSAVRVGGKRLHELTRQGIEVELPVREVDVRELSVLHWESPSLHLKLRVNKGFYVRSLARDIAAAWSTAAHLTELRRTHSGAFSLTGAVSQQELQAAARGEVPPPPVLSMPDSCRFANRAILSEQGVTDAGFGRLIAESDLDVIDAPHQTPALFALCDARGELVALAEKREGHYKVVRGFPREARCTDDAKLA